MQPFLVQHVRATSRALLLLSTLCMVLGMSLADADSGTFFLKATKNVPRIGRRSGGGDNTFFLKATKNVPRIGRRGSPWGAGLTEMRESGGWPWFRNPDNPIPSRAVRTGPTSIAGLWDGPSRLPARTQYNTNYQRAPVTAAEEPVLGWRSWSSEQENEISNSPLQYDIDDDADISASQLLAPPPAPQFQRLPLEGSYSRQRRDEQPEH